MRGCEETPGTSKQDSFGLNYLLVKSRFRPPPKGGRNTYTVISAHLCNSAAKRLDVAKQLLSQLWKVVEENDADIIAGDSNSSAYRERGREDRSSIDEAWSETLVVPPPGKVPTWGHMQESDDCCGFVLTKNSQSSWRVAYHGSYELNRDKLQKRTKGKAPHLTVYVNVQRKGRGRNKGCPLAAMLPAPIGRGSGPSAPPGRSPSADDILACRLVARDV